MGRWLQASALVMALTAGGCISRPHLVRQSFTFAAPAPVAGASSGPVLGARVMEVTPPYDGRLLVYRTGEFSFERDPYAEFLVLPADGLSTALGACFRSSGSFKAVTESGSSLRADTIAEIYVRELFGDFRKADDSAAVLAMRVVAFDAPNGAPGKVLFEKDYSRRLPVKERTPGALVAAWNQALRELADEMVKDLKTTGRP